MTLTFIVLASILNFMDIMYIYMNFILYIHIYCIINGIVLHSACFPEAMLDFMNFIFYINIYWIINDIVLRSACFPDATLDLIGFLAEYCLMIYLHLSLMKAGSGV